MPAFERQTALLATLMVLAAALPQARAGRPLQAEDAGVLDRGACELEGSTQRLNEPGAPRATGGALQVACGVGASSQIALTAQWARAAGVTANGLRLGGKTELWRGNGDSPAAFTLAWGLTSARVTGASWEHAATDVLGVLSLPLDGATLHLNLGHTRDETARQRSTPWAIAFEHAGFGAWAPMGELFGDDRGAPWWNLGLRFMAQPEKLFFDLSYGRQIAPGRPSLLTAGFKFNF